MPRFQTYAIILTLIVVSWAIAAQVVPTFSSGLRIKEDFSSIPSEIDDWSGRNLPEDENSLMSLRLLPTCSILSRQYVDMSGNSVNLSIVYGRDLGDFHQPEICMQGAGWTPMGKRTVSVQPVEGEPYAATAVTLGHDIVGDIVMVYWFYMGGKIVPSMQKQKVILDSLLGHELRPSAMVKFTTRVDVDEKTAETQSIRLASLLTPSIIEMAQRTPEFEDSDIAVEVKNKD